MNNYTKEIEHAYQIIKSEGRCDVKVIAERMNISIEEAKGLVGQLVLQGRIQKIDNTRPVKGSRIEDVFPGVFSPKPERRK